METRIPEYCRHSDICPLGIIDPGWWLVQSHPGNQQELTKYSCTEQNVFIVQERARLQMVFTAIC